MTPRRPDRLPRGRARRFRARDLSGEVQRDADRVAVVMERPGSADGHSIRIRKTDRACSPASPSLSVHYVLEDLPAGVCLHFAVEINLAAMAGHAPDRYYSDPAGIKLGMLDARLDLPHTRGLTLTDEWLDLVGRARLVAVRPASGASRSRRSARAKAASRASTNRRRSSPTGTSRRRTGPLGRLDSLDASIGRRLYTPSQTGSRVSPRVAAA